MFRKIQNYLKLAFISSGLFGCLFFAFLSYLILPRNDFETIGIPVSIGGGIIGILAGVFILSLYSRYNVNIRASASIDFFRSISFYNNMNDLTDLDIYRIINDYHQEIYGESINTNNPFFDLHITSFDKSRVWWKDTESDVCSGNNSYTKFLDELSKISRGSFDPSNITEKWESEEGPITVEYYLGNTHHKINPNFIDDYLDIEILRDINNQISSSGYRFEQFMPFDQTAFILVLTKKEKTDLKRKRGWKFYPL